MRSPKGRFRYSKAQAKSKGRPWALTPEEYCELIGKPCDYCQGPITETGYGLDRINNSLGYEPNNVLPCCSFCNYARNDHFTVDEMRTLIGPAIRKVRELRVEKLKNEKHEEGCKCLDGRYCAARWGGTLMTFQKIESAGI